MTIKEFIESPEKKYVRKWRLFRLWKQFHKEHDTPLDYEIYVRTCMTKNPNLCIGDTKEERLEAFYRLNEGIKRQHVSYCRINNAKYKDKYKETCEVHRRVKDTIKQLKENK